MTTSSRNTASVPLSQRLLAGCFFAAPGLWKELGDMETALLDAKLPPIEKPVFITSLARSGSTLMLELLSTVNGVGTHRYRDFPFIFTPVLWSTLSQMIMDKEQKAAPRLQQDLVEITPESPEAVEEMLWQHFYPQAHNPNHSSIPAQMPAGFEASYKGHIRKMLYVRQATRYVAKANYHITRLSLLASLFPDARFIITLREPVEHVASLLKQHRSISERCKTDTTLAKHLGRAGHFEFGPAFAPINPGDDVATKQVSQLMSEGRDVEAYALYWAMLHRFIARTILADETLKPMCLPVRFDELQQKPQYVLEKVLAHCSLSADAAPLAMRVKQARQHDWLSEADKQMIRSLTHEAAAEVGLA